MKNVFNILTFSILCFLGLTNSSFSANSDLKALGQIEVNTGRVSIENKMLLEHLKSNSFQLIEEKERLFNSLIKINSNLSSLSDLNTLFFLKSEFYKYFLDNPSLKSKGGFQISQSHILSIQSKFTKNKSLYSPLTQFLIEKILFDFSPFLKNNFLNNYLSLKDSKNFLKRERLKRVIKYLGPWVQIIESHPPQKLDNFISDVSLNFLESLATKSAYFQQNAVKSLELTTFLNLDSKKINAELESEQSKLNPKDSGSEKKEAEDFVKKLKIEKTPEEESKKIDELLNTIEEKETKGLDSP